MNYTANMSLELWPTDIRFIQDTISSRFQDGRMIDDVINDIRRNRNVINQIPLIKVINKWNHYYSFDNRRLYMFRVLECEGIIRKIKVKQVPADMLIPERFTTKNEGISIRLRQGRTRDHTLEILPSFTQPNQFAVSQPQPNRTERYFPFKEQPKPQINTISSQINYSYEQEEMSTTTSDDESNVDMTPSIEMTLPKRLSRGTPLTLSQASITSDESDVNMTLSREMTPSIEMTSRKMTLSKETPLTLSQASVHTNVTHTSEPPITFSPKVVSQKTPPLLRQRTGALPGPVQRKKPDSGIRRLTMSFINCMTCRCCCSNEE